MYREIQRGFQHKRGFNRAAEKLKVIIVEYNHFFKMSPGVLYICHTVSTFPASCEMAAGISRAVLSEITSYFDYVLNG